MGVPSGWRLQDTGVLTHLRSAPPGHPNHEFVSTPQLLSISLDHRVASWAEARQKTGVICRNPHSVDLSVAYLRHTIADANP